MYIPFSGIPIPVLQNIISLKKLLGNDSFNILLNYYSNWMFLYPDRTCEVHVFKLRVQTLFSSTTIFIWRPVNAEKYF